MLSDTACVPLCVCACARARVICVVIVSAICESVFPFVDDVPERQDMLHVRHLTTLLLCRDIDILVVSRSAFNASQSVALL